MMQRKTNFSNLFARAVFGLLTFPIPGLAVAAGPDGNPKDGDDEGPTPIIGSGKGREPGRR